MKSLFAKFNMNWDAEWRKAVVGAVLVAGMGGLYKLNKKTDERIDEAYPKPKNKDKTEDPAS